MGERNGGRGGKEGGQGRGRKESGCKHTTPAHRSACCDAASPSNIWAAEHRRLIFRRYVAFSHCHTRTAYPASTAHNTLKVSCCTHKAQRPQGQDCRTTGRALPDLEGTGAGLCADCNFQLDSAHEQTHLYPFLLQAHLDFKALVDAAGLRKLACAGRHAGPQFAKGPQ